MRIFLTKRETFLSAMLLYTILYNIVMNVFQRIRISLRVVLYTAINNFADGFRQNGAVQI